MAKKELVRLDPGAVVDEQLVDRTIDWLRRVIIGKQVEMTLMVGEHLVQHYYGSVEEAVARKPRKKASLRQLQERAEEFGSSARDVRDSVGIYLQAIEIGKGLSARLGVAQHRVLLPLRNVEEKKLLAETAAESGWTVEDLRTRVGKLQKRHRGGRRARPPVALLVARIGRSFDEQMLARRRESIDSLEQGEVKKLLGTIQTARRHLETLERELVRVVGRPRKGGR